MIHKAGVPAAGELVRSVDNIGGVGGNGRKILQLLSLAEVPVGIGFAFNQEHIAAGVEHE